MNRFFYEILNKLNVGIVLLDQEKKIVFWNHWMEQKTDLKHETVFSFTLDQVAPKFLRPKYSKILDTVIETGQARFLAGAVHGAFFSNIESEPPVAIQQNLQIERTENNFILIQVEDHTGHYQKVQHMKNFIKYLEKENDEIRQNEEESRQMAMHDVLTGLPNRLYLMNRLQSAIEEHKFENNENIIAVFFIDLDNLKDFNDQYGHRIGDAILREVSKRLKHAVRSSDTVARLSGDEFIIFTEGLLDHSDIDKVAKNILAQYLKPFIFDQFSLNLTISMGISMFPNDGCDAEELLDRADQALYKIKHSGKANYAFYEAE